MPTNTPTRRKRHLRQLWLGAFGSGLALALSAPIAAEPPAAESAALVSQQLAPIPLRKRRRPPEWMGENMHFKKGAGFEYRRDVRLGEREVVLGLQGPVVRKKKSLGLTLVVRF